MMFVWVPILVIVALGIAALIRRDTDPTYFTATHAHGGGHPSDEFDLLEIARVRLARGEISVAKFDEIRHALGF